MKLTQPFVRLPYTFDPLRLQAELKLVEDRNWLAHPSGMLGNTALPLISKDAGSNDEFDGHMRETENLKSCPYIRQVLSTVDQVYGRSRLMKLGPTHEVSQHVDFNYHWYSRVRIHVPMVTSSDVIFYCGNESIHMRPGECWIFDSWRHHRVVNNGTSDRTHLVFDTSGSSGFWQMVRAMTGGSNGELNSQQQKLIKRIPYVPKHNPVVKTERFNSAPVMAPGEMEGLANDLIQDLANNTDNDPALLRHYQQLLSDLVVDWRENWHSYGYQRDGWSSYRALLDRTVAQLDRNPRALTTASNDLGANPIIMQRILRAALRVEMVSHFK